MAMHKTNSLLKYVTIPIIIIVFLVIVLSLFHKKNPSITTSSESVIKDNASNDNAAESLDTLTADLSKTKQKMNEIFKANETLKQESNELINQVNSKASQESSKLTEEINELKNQLDYLTKKSTPESDGDRGAKSIAVVEDLSRSSKEAESKTANEFSEEQTNTKIIAYYTIPANGTSVHDRLMTALVGRIPVKGVVTDPYPFKIVISDDNLAANGLRISHLRQMIISGYCEGDLNLVSVRGWVTSLTFVFEDGTISSTTSNENDIGNFTKSNSLGYLSDKYGNPFIRGKLITNAPAYLAGNAALGASVGAANAYSESQTTADKSILGSSTTVTGNQGKFVLGQATTGAASEAQQWWRDRAEQSFDAIYVAPVDDHNNYVEIAVNFAKEIHIDYDPNGRKLNYAHDNFDTHLD